MPLTSKQREQQRRLRDRLNLPRVPLPVKLGGPHKRKNKVLDRKAKHKDKPEWDGDQFYDNFIDGNGR